MECAGRSAAEILDRLYPQGEVLAFIGAGNNGGDGLVMLRTLQAWGRPVRAVLVADRDQHPDQDQDQDQEDLLRGWQIPFVKDDGLEQDSRNLDTVLLAASIIVDGILGTGISGAPRERQARAIRAINRAAEANDYRMSSFILGVVKSDPFQMMRARVVTEAEPQQER